jgi:gliding motility-associated-like protein
VTDEAPNGIIEHQEVQFQLTITNTSMYVKLDNLQLIDDLNLICGGNIVAVSPPFIQGSTANINPNLNTTFNGTTSTTIFDGTSGLLMANESITIQFTVVFNEDCIGFNTASYTATDPINNSINSSESESVNVSSDSDSDGISNFNDIDDDNDTIPDTDEYNGIDPLGSVSPNFIPNYRNTSPLNDLNKDGIVDAFDFDNDGVPNHFDLDSDNDGILDIVEVENATLDTNNDGTTDNFVGINGLHNTVENSDGFGTSINYIIPNTDGDSSNNPNFLDIDADGDGIVDNIEAQTTANYNPPDGTVTISGIDTAYPNGVSPIDTENDTLFDYVDINSDNDIRNDVIEGWDFIDPDEVAETTPFNIDIDNDGLDDAFDSNNNLINPTNNQVPISFPNRDNVDTPERDWREIDAIVVLLDSISNEEGNDLRFTISLVKKRDTTLTQSAFPIDINLSTMNGTTTTAIYEVATAPFDYNEITSTTFRIPATTISTPNDTTLFRVNSLEDLIDELDELFTLTGIITSNNTLNTEIIGIGTIEDNDLPPSIKMDDSEQQEGVDLVHTIEISHPSSRPIEIAIRTRDETAISPDDYSAISETITIDGTVDPSNANIQKLFNIPTIIDNLNELDRESLKVEGTVTSSNVSTQDLIKTGTIIDIDPDPLIAVNNVTVVEGTPLAFTISLLNANAKLMRNYLPINFDLESVSETADVIQDFQLLSTSTSIPANTSSILQLIETVDDTLNEDSETMALQATITTTGVSNFSPFLSTTGTIKDNDFPNLFSPNSDGKSDVFKISGIKEFPNFILQIFDRWGSEVYNYKNKGNLNPTWWDGNYKGKPVIEGVYFYTLDFNDGQTPPRTNFIQLIR